MARWVDASDEQKFWQYTLPDARRKLKQRHFEIAKRNLESDAAWVKNAQAEVDRYSFAYRSYGRQLDVMRREYRTLLEQERFTNGIIAEAERRIAARAAKKKEMVA
jgi:hypothetical protein